MSGIDAIRINFNPDQLFVLNICLGFLMFGVALDLKKENFLYILKHPRIAFIGLSSQFILLPILSVLLILLLRPPTSIALGMILVASCPGGNVSNFAVHLSKANAALSVLLTSISTLGAIIITPIYFQYLSVYIPGAEAYAADLQVSPSDMAGTIIRLIVVPLIFGMWINSRFEDFTSKIKQPVKILSILIFLSFVVFAIYGNFENIKNYLHLVFFLVLIHNVLALSMGYSWAKLFKLPNKDAQAISLETGIQNSGLGLILIFNFFNGLGGMAMIAAWWGVWHLISAFSLAMWWKRKNERALKN
jgi:BASS family bile acid:Na+ symporter